MELAKLASSSSRGLNEDVTTEKPSVLIETLEKGFSAIATVLTDDVDTYVLSI